jgi:hypothetical protein
VPPSLYRVSSADGEAAVQLPFGAVGSGAADALAALETTGLAKVVLSHLDSFGTPSTYCNISVAEAIAVVRSAVRAGIANDLGSGFHVDLMAMTPSGRTVWREDCSGHEIKIASPTSFTFATDGSCIAASPGPDNGWHVVWNASTEALSPTGHGAMNELHRAKSRRVVPVIDVQFK